MSKLIDTLEKVGQSSPSPMGFGGTSRTASEVPEIALIRQVAADELISDRTLLDAEVDGVLVVPDSWSKRSLDRIRSALRGRTWGVRASRITESQVANLKDRGCDFIVFEVDETAAAVLNDDELGKIIVVDSELRGREARGIQRLSIDSVLLEEEDKLVPLTVRKLIEIQQSRGRFDKPFLLGTSSELSADDLEVIRNAGVQGLVMDLAATDAIAKTRETIAELPRRRSKSGSRNASVPHVPAGSAAGHEHDEDDQGI